LFGRRKFCSWGADASELPFRPISLLQVVGVAGFWVYGFGRANCVNNLHSAGMASEGAVMEAVADKKRVREEGEDAVESAVAHGNGATPAADENANSAEEDVDKGDAKRAKTEEADPVPSPMDVEVKKIVDSGSTVKDGKWACALGRISVQCVDPLIRVRGFSFLGFVRCLTYIHLTCLWYCNWIRFG
jgi:hypothetical protein